ncbi:hypothetical protein CLOSYM_01444 [[Clostridium] symbiosum ATCC 14940]|uniref:Secreted protein n=1 Tax=[Clostridium] symbiosum ATCC 14940 TaxID=411472 RepID=A0ABC9TZZ3_CLOSY|nr:hypothetical protein CLOSYM_01444 [[Clostridium] symbiosum ATCC 14940]
MLICLRFRKSLKVLLLIIKSPCYLVCDIGARFSDVEQFRGARCLYTKKYRLYYKLKDMNFQSYV